MADGVVVKKCPHGKRKNDCVECGGSSICIHKKRKFNCKECGGGAYCIHGIMKARCRDCGGSAYCSHNIVKFNCRECKGGAFCKHDKIKTRCKECGGSSLCSHNINKTGCKECNGTAYCEHKKIKFNCKECGGKGLCIHDKIKIYCKDCQGTGICIHQKQKHLCVECHGSHICPHNKAKSKCVECHGSQICIHNINKSNCKKCNGGGICEHNKQRSYCVDCGGKSICLHKKLKKYCKICGGSALCKSEWCHTIPNKKNEGYCLLCFIHLFPDKKTSRNYKTKEIAIRDELIKYFNNYQWTCDKKIINGKSSRRPDILLELEKQILIIEIDENQHTTYDCSCDNKRLMEISLDFEHKPIVFIRFNPDSYINKDNIKIKSCWKTGLDNIYRINKKYEKEWEERLNILKENIKYWLNNNTNKTIEVIELFYDQNCTKEIEI